MEAGRYSPRTEYVMTHTTASAVITTADRTRVSLRSASSGLSEGSDPTLASRSSQPLLLRSSSTAMRAILPRGGRGAMECTHSLICDVALVAENSVLMVTYRDLDK